VLAHTVAEVPDGLLSGSLALFADACAVLVGAVREGDTGNAAGGAEPRFRAGEMPACTGRRSRETSIGPPGTRGARPPGWRDCVLVQLVDGVDVLWSGLLDDPDGDVGIEAGGVGETLRRRS